VASNEVQQTKSRIIMMFCAKTKAILDMIKKIFEDID
jgi:hypothetical protein